MADECVRVLLVEDNPGDVRLLQELLKDARGNAFDVIVADRLATGLQRLATGEVDVALLDLALPDSQGLETLTQVVARTANVPIVVLTGLDDEALALEVMRRGAQDYLVKGHIEGEVLVRALRYAIERKEAEQHARQLQEEVLTAQAAAEAARQADALKSEFLATVSHELRTPMASLLGFAELLAMRQFPPAQVTRFAHIIHSEAQRLTALINDVLDLQRLEAGGMTYNFQPVTLAPLIAQIVAMYGQQSAVHTLMSDVPADLPRVRADEGRLRQVLANLVTNAIKYSPDGGEVCVTTRQNGGMVQVSVRDQGIGIPVEAQAHVFERFYRIPGPERERIRGTGLGLALVKELVEGHGGCIWAESAGQGHGSTFHFTLPVAAASPPGSLSIGDGEGESAAVTARERGHGG